MPIFRKFTREELSEEHYSTLRALGREMGVKSPTSKTSEAIIEEILAIQSGDLQPSLPTNKGARPKYNIDLTKFYEPSSIEFPKNDLTPAYFSDHTDSEAGYMEPIEAESETACEEKEAKEEKEDAVTGILEIMPSGYGFVRVNVYENSKGDVYISNVNIRRYDLKNGDEIKCTGKSIREGDSAALSKLISVNGEPPVEYKKRPKFDDLVPYYPVERIKLELPDREDDVAIRCMDLFVPLGKGQRGLIVAPPKTGKTTIMKKIAQSIEKNHSEIKLIVLLIDERPEEVTDMKRSISGEVVYSTFDENPDNHVKVAEVTINRAKRMVESGMDVVILMDSITKLARAYNSIIPASGKTLSGGIDPLALVYPKKFFGSARNIEGGGSLTIVSTALIETGSRMDDVIFEEFKGTGNMEIHLSRELSEKRVFPAIDIYKSGTRREELLLSEKELDATRKTRRLLAERSDASESLFDMIRKTNSNADFVERLDGWLKLYKK